MRLPGDHLWTIPSLYAGKGALAYLQLRLANQLDMAKNTALDEGQLRVEPSRAKRRRLEQTDANTDVSMVEDTRLADAIRKHDDEVDIDDDGRCDGGMMKMAVTEGDDAFMQWHLKSCLNNDADWLMPLAAPYGRVGVLEQVWERGVHEEVVKEALFAAARKGPVDAFVWFHEHVKEGWSKQLMDEAAEYGNLDVVQWLHENRPEGCTIFFLRWITQPRGAI